MNRKTRACILNLIAVVAVYLIISLMIDAKLISRGDRSTLMDIGIAMPRERISSICCKEEKNQITAGGF